MPWSLMLSPALNLGSSRASVVRMATRSFMAVRAMVRLMGARCWPGCSSQISSGISSPLASASRMKPRWQGIWAVTRPMTESRSSVRPAARSKVPAMLASRWKRVTASPAGCWPLAWASMASRLAWGTRIDPEASKARSSREMREATALGARVRFRPVTGSGTPPSGTHTTMASPSRTLSPKFKGIGPVRVVPLREVPFRDFMSMT